MSRRDTIILAVLINAGLLIILFATALKTKNDPMEMARTASAPLNSVATESIIQQSYASPAAIDEIERASVPQEALSAKAAPVLPATEVSSPEIVNFAADLNAITLPEVAPSIQASPVPVAVAEEKASLDSSSYTEIKVKKGDVLEKIARHHHTTVDEIMKVNKLSSTNLKIGQVLKIPAKGVSVAKQTSSPSKIGGGSPKYYTVKNGDNPWTIAVKNHIKVEDLLKLNNLDEEKARRLKPGDQLRIE